MHMWILIQLGRMESCGKMDETIVSKFCFSCVSRGWGRMREATARILTIEPWATLFPRVPAVEHSLRVLFKWFP